MSLDHATIRRIASLARIRVEDHEVEPLCQQLNGILGWIEQLNEVDVSNVAGMVGTGPVGTTVGQAISLRADVVTDGGYAEKVLSNAPERIGDFYVVPKVVE